MEAKKMKPEHLKSELEFYAKAFGDNASRRGKAISWEYTSSRTIIEIIKANNLAKSTESKRALDLGCGDGRHSAYFRELGFYVAGVDFCEEAVQLCADRFKKDSEVHLELVDLTEENAISHLGEFDLVLDWSVLDHIRREYLPVYLQNVIGSVKEGGHLIAAEFDISVRKLYQGKDFKCRRGHYSRGFTLKGLVESLNPLVLVDYREKVLEDEITGYRFNTVLMKKPEGV